MIFLFMSFPPPLSTYHSTSDTRPFLLNHLLPSMSTIAEIVGPRTLAVFKLITSSNFVGSVAGMNSATSPFSFWATYSCSRLICDREATF